MGSDDRLPEDELFGRYRIVRLLGEGGMGAVYEAIHPVLKKRVAIKTLLPALAAQADARARFLREGEAASRINHPNVVAVHDVGTVGETPFLVMEYLEGETLDALLGRRSVLSVVESVDIMLPVISAVAAGHDQGVIHRDLKPQNIFLSRGPWGEAIPKVLDFGVSKLVGDLESAVLTGTQAVLGTVAYMSPEQARGARGVDAKSDQYAIGLILYEMVTGGRAHPGESALEILHHIASGTIVPPRVMRPDLLSTMDEVLVRCLAAQPRDRFPSLRLVGQALLPLAGEKTRFGLADRFRDPVITEVAAATPVSRRTMVMPPEAVPPLLAGGGLGAGTPAPAAAAPVEAGRGSAGGAGRTRILTPPPRRAPDSTFRQAASELGTAPDLRKKSRTPVAVLSVALLAGAAAAAFVMARRGLTDHEPNARDTVDKEMTAPVPPAQAPPPASPVAPPATPTPTAAAPAAPARVKRIEVRVVPPHAQIVLDDGRPNVGRLNASMAADEVPHTLHISADGYADQTITFGADDTPPALVTLARLRGDPRAARPPLAAHPPRARRGGARGAGVAAAAAGSEAPVIDEPPPAPAAPAAEPSNAPPAPRRGANNALILK
ncbi:MAG TPA: serine/threonine-protein kinase [Polyangia bacterium]|jgi:serine/threonine-protein kinase|nr:serine/threonine-protein kinase [Polyangia bacterium]